MLISDTSGHGHGDNNGDNSGDNSGDKSGDKSGEKCVNKRFGAISPTLYAVQYTGTDIHNSRFIVYDIFRSCIVRSVRLLRVSLLSG